MTDKLNDLSEFMSIHDVRYSAEGKDEWALADDAINEAYPDFYNKGKGKFWGAQRIPNAGILRGAIAHAIKHAINNLPSIAVNKPDNADSIESKPDNAHSIEEVSDALPVAYVFQNDTGQISLTDARGGAFDISKYINAKLYLAPPSTPQVNDAYGKCCGIVVDKIIKYLAIGSEEMRLAQDAFSEIRALINKG